MLYKIIIWTECESYIMNALSGISWLMRSLSPINRKLLESSRLIWETYWRTEFIERVTKYSVWFNLFKMFLKHLEWIQFREYNVYLLFFNSLHFAEHIHVYWCWIFLVDHFRTYTLFLLWQLEKFPLSMVGISHISLTFLRLWATTSHP